MTWGQADKRTGGQKDICIVRSARPVPVFAMAKIRRIGHDHQVPISSCCYCCSSSCISSSDTRRKQAAT